MRSDTLRFRNISSNIMRKERRRRYSACSSTVTGILFATTLSILVITVPLLLVQPCQVSCFVSGDSIINHHNHRFNNMRNRRSPNIIPGKKSSPPRPPLVPVVPAGTVRLSSSSPATAGGVIFDNGPNLRFQLIILSANALGYIISLLFRGLHLHVDLLGTGAFALGALPALLNNPVAMTATNAAAATARIKWSSVAVITWSVRLAGFLFYRILGSGHDARLDDILIDPVYAAGFWIYSALWGISCALPYSLGLTSSSSAGYPMAMYSGMTLFGIGWLVECLADYQKWMFKRSNPGEFCNIGLWSISQHPNWFGNLILWAGIFVMNAPALVDPSGSVVAAATGSGNGAFSSLWRKIWSYRRVALALIGPAFMLNLFYSQATGSLMADVFQANREKYGYGTKAAFTEYIDKTPLIFPNPFKWFSKT